MPDTASARTGLVGKSCPVPESGTALHQEPPVAVAAATIISFVAQILLFGQALAQLLLWREEANTQAPFRGRVGSNSCVQQALETAGSSGKPWIYCSDTSTAARQ